ncbi:MAG: SWIM zinc finger family protein, partial [bacterium]
MPLYRRCLNAFNTSTRFKGLAYHSHGQVTVEHADAECVLARVQGTYPYKVSLHAFGEFHNPSIEAYCSCPHFADGFFCKHLWATLLAMEESAVDFDLPGSGAVHFVQAGENGRDHDNRKIIYLDEWQGVKGRGAGSPTPPAKKSGKSSLWRSQLHPIQAVHRERAQSGPHSYRETRPAPRRKEIWFYLNVATTSQRGHLNIDFFQRELLQNGNWGKIKILRIAAGELDDNFAGEDRELLELLLGNRGLNNSYYNSYGYHYGYYDSGYNGEEKFSGCTISAALYEIVLPRLCATKRFGWVEGLKKGEPMNPLDWDGGAPWEFKLRIDRDGQEKAWRIWGNLVRDGEEIDLSAPIDYLSDGLAIFPDRLAYLEQRDDASWLALLREKGPILIPFSQQNQFAEWFFNLPVLPRAELPAEMNWSQVVLDPQPRLSILKSDSNNGGKELKCRVSFDYEGQILPLRSPKAAITDRVARKVLIRNHAFENRAVAMLEELGLRKAGNREQADYDML